MYRCIHRIHTCEYFHETSHVRMQSSRWWLASWLHVAHFSRGLYPLLSNTHTHSHTHTHTHTLLYTEASGRKIVWENLSLQNMLSSICSKKNTCILHSSRLRLALWISLFPLLLSSLLHVHATRERTPHKYRVAKTHRMPYPIDHFPQISH